MPWCLGPWPRHGIAAGWDLRRRSCRCMAPRETQLADTHCRYSCQAPRTLNRGVSEEKKGEARALAFRTHFAHRTPSLPPPMKSRQSAQGSPLIQNPGGHVGWLQSLSVLRHRSGGHWGWQHTVFFFGGLARRRRLGLGATATAGIDAFEAAARQFATMVECAAEGACWPRFARLCTGGAWARPEAAAAAPGGTARCRVLVGILMRLRCKLRGIFRSFQPRHASTFFRF